jgi:YHS domain-containing protein
MKFMILPAFLALGACNEPSAPAAAAPATIAAPATAAAPVTTAGPRVIQSPVGTLTETPADLVCMVNNAYMGRPQMPVEVEGVTYFACCDMCVGRLNRDPASRLATDPVSGRPVNKAKAVMARTDDGKMFYFENAENFLAYGQR